MGQQQQILLSQQHEWLRARVQHGHGTHGHAQSAEVGVGVGVMSEPERKEMSEADMVRIWLTTKVKLPQYLPLFMEHGYDDMEVVREMNDAELRAIGIDKAGHRKRILRELRHDDVDEYHQAAIAAVTSVDAADLVDRVVNEDKEGLRRISKIKQLLHGHVLGVRI